MGVKYSKITKPPIEIKQLHGLDILTIRSKIIGIAKKFQKSGIYFISKDELKWTFNFTDIQVYQCFQVFDFSNMARISCLDFWGTLILTGTDPVHDKVNFCFKMMDLNNDSFLSYNDAIVLTKCITRGIARLRCFEPIPGEIVEKLVISTFKANAKVLNEGGEISMHDFRTYILADDRARAYISNLGTKVPAVDTAAVVVKRSNLQSEVAEVQAEIARLLCEIQEINEDSEAFLRERGGDAHLVKITQGELLQVGGGSEPKSAQQPVAENVAQRPPSRALTPSQHNKASKPTSSTTDTMVSERKGPMTARASMVSYLRNVTKSASQTQSLRTSQSNKELLSAPPDHPSSKYFRKTDAYGDADVFSDSRACKPAGTSRNLFGENFKSSLLLLWSKLPRDSPVDCLAALDEFTLISLFDNVGVVLPYHHARLCLREHLVPSQTGLYNFTEVLRWYQLFASSADIMLSRSPDECLLNSYSGALSSLFNFYTQCCRRLQSNLDLVKTQRSILNDIEGRDPQTVCRYLSTTRVVAEPKNSSKPSNDGRTSGRDQNLVLKWVEFRNLSMKKPTAVLLRYFFGHPEIIPITTPPSETNTASSSPTAKKGKKVNTAHFQPKFKSVKLEEINDWGMKIQFTATSNPFTNLSTKRPKEMSRIKLLSDAEVNFQFESRVMDYIEDYSNLQAQDCLDFMNLRLEKDFAAQQEMRSSRGEKPSTESVKVFTSVVWFCVELRAQMHFEQELILVHTLRNYFLSLPFHLRQHVFSEVFVHGFNAYSADDKGKGGNQQDSSGNNLAGMLKSFVKSKSAKDVQAAEEARTGEDEYFRYKGRRVVLVALYHETDQLQEVEKILVEHDVFASRALHRLFFELVSRDSFADLLAKAQPYEHFEAKLYGPQEEELGEEGMNPLKFAKNLRAQKKTIADNISRVISRTMPREEMLRLCKEYGCRDTGTVHELSEVLLKALEMANELVGFGELSQFGRSVVEGIFAKYKPSAESRGEYQAPSISGKDYDSGMLLWEFNALLSAVDAPTLFDVTEYKSLTKELELLLDRSDHLKVEGLMNYYLNNGRLATDNNMVGVGSLNEAMKGRVTISSTYEPDALASLLSLVGRNNILADSFMQYMVRLSAVKEAKLEGELDLLSDLLDMLQQFVIQSERDGDADKAQTTGRSAQQGGKTGKASNVFAELNDLLKSPGWLARVINALSQLLADGDEGVIPTLRQTTLATYGKFDRWKSLFNDELVAKIRAEVRAADESARNRLMEEQREERERRQREAAEAKAASDKMAALLNGVAKTSSTNSGLPAPSAEGVGGAVDDENEESGESHFAAKERQLAVATAVLSATLPPLSQHNGSDLPAELLQLKRDLIFLSELNSDLSVELSLQESKQVAERKESFLKRMEVIAEQLEECNNLLAAHSCAVYDSIRLFGKSVSSVGAGSKDFCVRSSMVGVDFLELLPEGLGELSPGKQANLDKVARAQQRKTSALAALERERQRRNMTEEEKEKIRQEQLAAQLKLWEAEELQMYTEACDALFVAREERKTTAEIAAMIKFWEALMSLKESRYVDTLQVAVSQNNVGCLLLEFYGLDHPLGAGAVYVLQAAADIVMIKAKLIAEKVAEEKALLAAQEAREAEEAAIALAKQLQQHGDGEEAEGNVTGGDEEEVEGDGSSQQQSVRLVDDNREVSDENDNLEQQSPEVKQRQASVGGHSGISMASVDSSRISVVQPPNVTSALMEAHEILPTIVILANYVTALIKTDSLTQLKQSFDMKSHVYDLLGLLSDKERERLDNGVINSVRGMDVFCFEKPRDCLEPVVREIVHHFAEIQRIADEERQRLIDAELAAQSIADDSTVASTVVLTKAQLRAEAKLRKAEQRKLDTQKRLETSQQRKMLYELIQSDQITAIFQARASKVTLANAPKWGSFKNVELEQQDQGLSGLAASLSTKPSVAKSSKVTSSGNRSSSGGVSSNTTINSTLSGSRDD